MEPNEHHMGYPKAIKVKVGHYAMMGGFLRSGFGAGMVGNPWDNLIEPN
jgi:hypothetical protein